VENLVVSREEQKLDEPFNKTVVVEWRLPCRSNANITEFIISFTSNSNDELREFVEVVKNQDDYSTTVNTLLPDTSYRIKVQAVANGEIKGKESATSFEMEAGCRLNH
jgi:hypothetical protein